MDGTGRRRIYLMRHGHVDYFAPGLTDPRGVPLTSVGCEQAESAAIALQRQQFDVAAYSGLPRTLQTAKIVLKAQSNAPELQEFNGLEEIKSGWLKVDSREELAARLAFCFDNAGEKGAAFLPDGETFEAAAERAIAAIEELIFTQYWKTALVVAHEGINRILLGWACGGGLNTVAAFEQDLCCINVIDVDVTPADEKNGLKIERLILKTVNVTPYDYVKDGLPKTSLEHLFDVDFGGSRPRQQQQNV